LIVGPQKSGEICRPGILVKVVGSVLEDSLVGQSALYETCGLRLERVRLGRVGVYGQVGPTVFHDRVMEASPGKERLI
jgi:hypothetical protein